MSEKKKTRRSSRYIRKKRISYHVSGNTIHPRICLFISNTKVYSQAIDDINHHTIASVEIDGKTMKDAREAGKQMAALLMQKKISTGIFDRSGYAYHGRVQSFADSLRKEGIKI